MTVNLPREFVNRIKEQLGDEAESFLSSYNEPWIKSLRLNPLKKQVDITSFFPTAVEEVPWEKNGRYYGEDEPGKSPLHAAGAYYIQEASAMAPVSRLMSMPLSEGERILDLCAAPGGKSTQLAGYMEGRGLLVCNEIVASRAKILSENIERMGVENALVVSHSPGELAERFPGFFTRILVDAPCSGEGMFRKHPEAAGEWSPENVEMCAARQDEILDAAFEMLSPGGYLEYSTCTFAPAEDEGSVERFMARHSEMGLVDINQANPLRLAPHRVKGEGHFAALMKKEGELPPPPRTAASGLKGCDSAQKKLFQQFLEDNITLNYVNQIKDRIDNARPLVLFGKNLYLAPPFLPDIGRIKVERCGLMLGSFEKNRFEPAHSLALCMKPEDCLRVVEADEAMAKSFLAGMTLSCDPSLKGWCVVSYEGFNLGWGKCSNGIVKNHYPRGLRIF
ncbi:MAG: RsmB/NOP family class I SAM-dependent RNA methyltransferase [Lachnospiraceae bacterium]|nr:RsmB/NOP family class I SAM-dependent RNA methyltransferase [Lachnospiraceae bacterium]